jgi:hypothetical protein
LNTDGLMHFGRIIDSTQVVLQKVLNWLRGPLPTVIVLSPNGGEEYFVGDTCIIQWEGVSFSDSVVIEYSTDGGSNWLPVGRAKGGSYHWVIPDTPSDECLVRIFDVDNGIPIDTSDDFFVISDYVPGDASGDLVVNVGDAIYLLNYLFKNGDPPVPTAAGDVNADCVVNVGDAIYILNYLFKAGDPPQPGCA